MRRLIFFAGLFLCASVSAQAQQAPSMANVVSACGTPNSTYTANATKPTTVDTNGNFCQTGSGGGAVTANTSTTTSAPTYVNGTSNAISTDVHGGTRVLIMDTTGNPIDFTTASLVNLSAATTGGCTPYHLAGGTTASTNSTLIGTAGVHTLCSISAVSVSGTLGYLRIYDTATAPTCSSATGAVVSLPVPANTSGAGVAPPLGPFGASFTAGIGFCVTGGGTDTDNTNAPTGIYITATYK